MTDYDPTIAERNERLKTNNEKYGIVRVNFWLPKDKVEAYKKRAEKDRTAHRKKLGLEK